MNRFVVPANAGTHNHRPQLCRELLPQAAAGVRLTMNGGYGSPPSRGRQPRPRMRCGRYDAPWLWVPAFAGTTAERLRRGHDHRVALRRERDVEAAGLRQEARVIWLHGVSVDRAVGRAAEQVGDVLWHARVEAAGRDAEAAGLGLAGRVD